VTHVPVVIYALTVALLLAAGGRVFWNRLTRVLPPDPEEPHEVDAAGYRSWSVARRRYTRYVERELGRGREPQPFRSNSWLDGPPLDENHDDFIRFLGTANRLHSARQMRPGVRRLPGRLKVHGSGEPEPTSPVFDQDHDLQSESALVVQESRGT
jgi:hypothetical protein